MTTNSKKIKELCDETKYSKEQILANLKNCMIGKKACIFSCGYNLIEHKDNFYRLQNNDNILTCCVKSAITYLNYNCDILLLVGIINGNYLDNKNIDDIIILSDNLFNKSYNKLKNYLDIDYFKIINIKCKIFWLIYFMIYIGITEIYLFGFYLSDYIINDLYNYTYYKDIICKKSHLYDKDNTRTKEPGLFIEHIESSYINDFCNKNNCQLFNVSELGALSNYIKRIDYESIFEKNKNIIQSKIKYKDLLDEINNKLDVEYYYNKYCLINRKDDIDTKKYKCIQNLMISGIYKLNKLNKNDPKQDIIITINSFIYNIICLFSYLHRYNALFLLESAFFCHYLIKFNNTFNTEFYEDFNKISKEEFYINLLIKYHNQINKNINLIHDIKKIFNEPIFINNKYCDLFIYMIYINKLPKGFNCNLYKNLNLDLFNLNNHELIFHYVNCGKSEKRKYKLKNIPHDFQYNIYKFFNNDLKNMNKYELVCHYELNGHKENRKYKSENIPKDFDYNKYKSLNPDLKNLGRIQLILHYENHGYKENRKYK